MNFNNYKNQIKGIIFLLLTAIIWGASFITQYFGGLVLGSFTFTAYRGILAVITLLPIILIDNFFKTKKIVFFREDDNPKHIIKNSLFCGFFLFLAIITQQIGVENTDTAKSGIIAALEVIFVPIIMLIMFKRKIKVVTWIFIFTAMIGIMMLSANSVSGINIGDLFVLTSTILYSITAIQIPIYAKDIDALKFSFFRFILITILSIGLAFLFKENPLEFFKLKEATFSVLFSGIFAAGLAYTFQVFGQKYCDPVIATLIISLSGIFAAVFGWIFLHQSLNLIQIFGIILAFVSIVFVEITDNNVVDF